MESTNNNGITLSQLVFRKIFNIDNLLIILAVLTLVGLFFFPRMVLSSGAKIRLEDITFIFIFAIIFYKAARKEFRLYQETIFPLIYYFYGFIISFLRAITGADNFGYSFIVFWGKEFQYYLFFLLFYYLFIKGKTKTIILSLLALVSINSVIGAYKIITGARDNYGIGAKFMEEAPSLSGQVYFSCVMIAIFFIYLAVFQKPTIGISSDKLRLVLQRLMFIILSFVIIASSLSCLATESKSSAFGLIVFLVMFIGLNDIRQIKGLKILIYKYLKWIVLLIISLILVYLYYNVLDYKIGGINLARLRNPIESTIRRYDNDIKPKFSKVDGVFEYITGIGYLAGQVDENKVWYTSAYDSQYGRNILVLGIIGTIIWFIMLLNFGWFIRKNSREFVIYISLLVSYLIMGVGVESFGASKSGPIFWIITGILLALKRVSANNYDK